MQPDDYHAHPAYSSSDVRLLLKQPASVLRWRKTEAGPSSPTPAMQRGTWTHTLVLEPDKWEEPAKLTAAQAKHLEQAHAMAASVRQHPAAAAILKQAQHIEYTSIIEDATTGLALKARPDLITSSRWLVDLKTSADISDSSVPWQFRACKGSYRYDLQLAHYLRVLRQDPDSITPKGALAIFVESNAPYPCRVLEIPNQLLDRAAQEHDALLQRLQACHQSDRWSGYPDHPQMLPEI